MVANPNKQDRISDELHKRKLELKRAIPELLVLGQYEEIERIIDQERAHADREIEPYLNSILIAAKELCQTCQKYQNEISLHSQARLKAETREAVIREQLASVLNLSFQFINSNESDALKSDGTIIQEKDDNQRQRPGLVGEISNKIRRWLQTFEGGVVRGDEDQEEISVQDKVGRYDHAQKKHEDLGEQHNLSGEESPPILSVYCLGGFQVYEDDRLIRKWPNGKGKSIFKYLICHRQSPVSKDVLMDVFWPGIDYSDARNSLNVAIYSLRQVFRMLRPEFSHILYQNENYFFNMDLEIWVDAEAFLEKVRLGKKAEDAGKMERAMREYRAAENLYQGSLFEEDRYEDWLVPKRQHFQEEILKVLGKLCCYSFNKEDYDACVSLCLKILQIEACQESAHCCLMRVYSRLGSRHLALRQFHQCCERLRKELNVGPTPQTIQLFEQIRNHAAV